jgi:transcriptional regulator with XRE-family HTH domain
MDVNNFKLEVGRRLKQFIFDSRIEQKDFAESIGYSAAAFSSIAKGKSGLSSDFVNLIIEKHPSLNWHWLLTGKGEMEIKIENGTGVVFGDNNGTMHIQKTENPEMELLLLRERVKFLERELLLKDEIIQLYKNK